MKRVQVSFLQNEENSDIITHIFSFLGAYALLPQFVCRLWQSKTDIKEIIPTLTWFDLKKCAVPLNGSVPFKNACALSKKYCNGKGNLSDNITKLITYVIYILKEAKTECIEAFFIGLTVHEIFTRTYHLGIKDVREIVHFMCYEEGNLFSTIDEEHYDLCDD